MQVRGLRRTLLCRDEPGELEKRLRSLDCYRDKVGGDTTKSRSISCTSIPMEIHL